MDTLFENEQFIIVDKPGGWLSVPSNFGEEDPRPVLSLEVSKKLGQQIWPVHRLDLDVTGVVLLAKNARAHQLANTWFENRSIDKTYEAWTEGEAPAERSFEWSSMLQRGKKRSFESPKGKLAVTRAYWRKTSEFNGLPIQQWALDPITGRPHQLRVHLSKNGFPILGDKLYGSTREFFPSTLALRAVRLDFSQCEEAQRLGLPKDVSAPNLQALTERLRQK
ncbi:MAG TPA: RNA pseudouridine synthase [Bdellovibrionales bacterium]|nr:RNA pseudouridine synthase [Bdellovibrionales bacterium]